MTQVLGLDDGGRTAFLYQLRLEELSPDPLVAAYMSRGAASSSG